MKVSLFQGLVVIDNLMTLKFKKKQTNIYLLWYLKIWKNSRVFYRKIYGNLTVLISRNIKLVNFLAINQNFSVIQTKTGTPPNKIMGVKEKKTLLRT